MTTIEDLLNNPLPEEIGLNISIKGFKLTLADISTTFDGDIHGAIALLDQFPDKGVGKIVLSYSSDLDFAENVAPYSQLLSTKGYTVVFHKD